MTFTTTDQGDSKMKQISINGTIVAAHNDYDTGRGSWVFISVMNEDGQCLWVRTTKALLKMNLRFGDRLVAEARRSTATGCSNVIVGLKSIEIERGAGTAEIQHGFERGAAVNESADVFAFFRHEIRQIEASA
jgi:hypothetical protein